MTNSATTKSNIPTVEQIKRELEGKEFYSNLYESHVRYHTESNPSFGYLTFEHYNGDVYAEKSIDTLRELAGLYYELKYIEFMLTPRYL